MPYCGICLGNDRRGDLALILSTGGEVLLGRLTKVLESYVHRGCYWGAVRLLEPFDHAGDWPHRPLLAGPVPGASTTEGPRP